MSLADITAMREQRASLIEQMRAINDAAEVQGRDLSGEEQQTYDRLEGEHDSLVRRIKRSERLESLESETTREAEVDVDSAAAPAESREAPEAGSDEYREHFERFLRSRGYSAEARAALAVGTDTQGGYLVPTDLANRILVKADQLSNIRQLATILTTSSGNPIDFPAEDSSLDLAWRAESGAYTEDEPTFTVVTLNAHSGGFIVKASDELLDDSAFDIQSYIVNRAGKAIAKGEDTAFINGAANSTTSPKGLVNLATVGVTAASASAITADEVIDLYYALASAYRSNAVWLFSDSVMKAITQLKDANNQYIWRAGLATGMPDTLLGKPVYDDPFVPAIAASAVVGVFGDIETAYTVRQVNGLRLKVLNEKYADNGQVGFRFDIRVDGALMDSSAVTSLKMGSGV